jgi:hypothetical protein
MSLEPIQSESELVNQANDFLGSTTSKCSKARAVGRAKE